MSITDNQIYLQVDFSAKLLSLRWSSIEILALAKPVKPTPFVRPKDSDSLPASSIFCSNAALTFARKSRQFMKEHVDSDEKFSSGFSARFEFLRIHSLQFVQFCSLQTQVLCPGSASLFSSDLSFFVFSRVVPFPPAAMKSFSIYLRFRVFYSTSTAEIVHTKYNSGGVFIQSRRIKLLFESQ